MDLDVYFQKGELIPAVVVEEKNGAVLMLAYMNKESLQKTMETGYTWFYSRSRQELWNKGATSGHLQKVKSIVADCDNDTLLVTVNQTGVACHTGSYSCFSTRSGKRTTANKSGGDFFFPDVFKRFWHREIMSKPAVIPKERHGDQNE